MQGIGIAHAIGRQCGIGRVHWAGKLLDGLVVLLLLDQQVGQLQLGRALQARVGCSGSSGQQGGLAFVHLAFFVKDAGGQQFCLLGLSGTGVAVLHGFQAKTESVGVGRAGILQNLFVQGHGLEGLLALIPAIAIPASHSQQCNGGRTCQRAAPGFPEMANGCEFFLFLKIEFIGIDDHESESVW